jgi:polar amino acid transport system permease protein
MAENLAHYALFIAGGLRLTLILTFFSLLVGLIGGIAFSTLRYQYWLRFAIDGIVSVLRGTPMILQLNFFYFVVPGFDILTAGICTLGLNSSAYVAEILRGGVESLPKGQFEASKTLRIPTWLMWKDIILPQVFRNELPTLVNEYITILKETSLISTLGGMDLMRQAQTLAAEKFDYFGPL